MRQLQHHKTRARRWRKACAAVGITLLLSACGGGGGSATDAGATSASCSVAAQKNWLRDYMNEWYFWYRTSPSPDPAAYASVDSYFGALLFTGDTVFPRDRYSGSGSTAGFTQFFEEGKTLGYGLFVAGAEVIGRPDQPLRVRYVEALSDAATQGIARGDEILTINGRSAADIIRASDFAALTPAHVGDTLALQLRGASGTRTLTLTASTYALTPVSLASVATTSGGRPMGYLFVKDMVSQTAPGLAAAFEQFRAAGITELALDLRYNGGGLVSVGAELASYIAGVSRNAQTYASLLYNDKRAPANNATFRFGLPSAALDLRRVFVLMGPRTCSASEQLISGLRGIGVEVVTIGATSCGKPVGFLPKDNCGTTFSVVNFESVNARNEGRYFDGLAPACPVPDDLGQALGAVDEALLASARGYADTGKCGNAAASMADAPAVRARLRSGMEPGERGVTLPR